MKWLNTHQVLLWLIIVIIGGVAYTFTTFATTSNMKEYVTMKYEPIHATLIEIKQDIKDIKQDLRRRRR